MPDTPMNTFIDILITCLTVTQLQEILEQVTNSYSYGHCPLCGMAEGPVDQEENPIEPGEDVSGATWREQHDEDCPVTRIEAYFRQSHPTIAEQDTTHYVW